MTAAAAREATAAALHAVQRAQGPLGFGKRYVGHLVPGTFSPLHYALADFHVAELYRPPGALEAVAAPRGHGKACSLSTVIPTPTGWTTMDDIRPGDLVLGRDGRPATVLHKSPVMHDRECYRVTLNDGHSVVVDAEHLWTIEPRDAKPRTLTTRELLGVARGRRRLPLTAPIDLDPVPLPVDPYTLGVFLSEGARHSGLLTLNRADADHIEARVAAAGYVTRRTPSGERDRSVAVRAVGLAAVLRATGVLGVRRIPPAYLRGARASRQALLEAIVDCDGHVSPAGQVEITTTASHAYAEDLAELVHTLGMKCRVYQGRATIDGRDVGPKWRVMWTPYQPVASLPRKAARVLSTGPQRERQYARIIDRIEPVASELVACITVDTPDHLYLVGRGMVPTHNSTVGVEVAALWHAAYCVRRYIVIASDTATQAEKRLATIVEEIEGNEELRAAFPRLRPAMDQRKQLVKWTDSEIALECGCRIVAVGAGRSIRGAKAGATRPDLLLLDDIEDEGSVSSEGTIEKRLRWITRTALALAGPRRGISALWVGTIISRAALLNAVTGAALEPGTPRPEWGRAWSRRVYRAELDVDVEETTVDAEDGTPVTYRIGRPLWRDLTRADLARIRLAVGPLSYAAEYLSDPVEEGTRLLAPPREALWLNPDAPPLSRIARLPNGQTVPVASMTRAAALDPQYGQERPDADPDLAAVAIVGQYGAWTFLLDGWIGRDRHGQAGRLVDLGTRWAVFAARVESNAAQVLTADAAAQLARIPVVAETSSKDKVQRALGLAVRLGDREKPETCRVFAMPDALDFLPYLRDFPHGRYDDPVDAVVMAVDLATRSAPATVSSGPALGGTRAT